MNEQIKQLAEQAFQLVVDEHANGDDSRLDTDSCCVKDLIQEKFAQLIIQECVRVVRAGGGMCGAISSNNLTTHFRIEVR